MSVLNRLLSAFADFVLGPFAGGSAWPALVAVSFLSAGLLVAVFHFSSNQGTLRRARNRFVARTLELLLFRHDLRTSLAAVGRILAANVVYFGQFLVPVVVSLIPMVLLLVQMAAWFESRPLAAGEPAVLNVVLAASHPVTTTPVVLEAPESLAVETEAVRIPARNEVSWRLRARVSGAGEVEIRVGDEVETKRVVTGNGLARVSDERVSSGTWEAWLHPSEPALASGGPVRRIELRHPARQLFVGEAEVHWLVAAILLMMGFGLALGRIFGVRMA